MPVEIEEQAPLGAQRTIQHVVGGTGAVKAEIRAIRSELPPETLEQHDIEIDKIRADTGCSSPQAEHAFYQDQIAKAAQPS